MSEKGQSRLSERAEAVLRVELPVLEASLKRMLQALDTSYTPCCTCGMKISRAYNDVRAAETFQGTLQKVQAYGDSKRLAEFVGIDPRTFDSVLLGQHDILVGSLAEIGALLGYSLRLQFVDEIPNGFDDDGKISDPGIQASVRESIAQLAELAKIAPPEIAAKLNEYRQTLEARCRDCFVGPPPTQRSS